MAGGVKNFLLTTNRKNKKNHNKSSKLTSFPWHFMKSISSGVKLAMDIDFTRWGGLIPRLFKKNQLRFKSFFYFFTILYVIQYMLFIHHYMNTSINATEKPEMLDLWFYSCHQILIVQLVAHLTRFWDLGLILLYIVCHYFSNPSTYHDMYQ